MDGALIAFFISLLVVVVVCTIIAISRQIKNEQATKDPTVSGSHNHIMQTNKYSGKYSVCKKIGEAHEEF